MPKPVAHYRLGIVSTYLPRQCGLATYTADLREALDVATDDLETVVVAIDRDGLTYGPEVITTIEQDRITDYEAAARMLRDAGVQIVLIQHEYGIFGGPDGAHVLHLARALDTCGIPYIVTLHTVLSRPSSGQAATLRTLCARAAKVTVFTETARQAAIQTAIAAGHQLVVVPHGAPATMRTAPDRATLRPRMRDLLDRLAGKPTLTTFGLLSEGKGIDLAIDALAEVVLKHPDTQYVVAGATHPEIKRHEGEVYRERLQQQVGRLGLVDNVHFVDAFLNLDELSALLHASTLFVTPYRSRDQICSGALTFALGAGLPAVSSDYSYARDLLAGGAGRVVPCRDVPALAGAIRELLGDEVALTEARTAAAHCATWLPWPAVAGRAAELFRDVVHQASLARAVPAHATITMPALRLEHLDRITDEIGIIQFASFGEPDPRSGYCVDDVARLAIVAADLLAAGVDERSNALATRWLRQSLRFLIAAYDPSGAMHNVLSYGGTWQDWPHLGDHVGRAVWSLGVLVGTPEVPVDVRRSAGALLDQLAPHTGTLAQVGLRSAAYALIGLARAAGPVDAGADVGRHAEHAEPLLRRIDDALSETIRTDDTWFWFEPELTYDNARLAQAALLGAQLVGSDAIADRAIAALGWYARHVGLMDGTLRCVGNHWHRRGQAPQLWIGDDGDEQPLDAAALVEALADAYRHSANADHARLAGIAFGWFVGRNRAGVPLYVEQTGGCYDGLSPSGPNENQGAESTLAYYQALLGLVRAGLAALPHSAQTEPSLAAVGKTAARLTAARQITVSHTATVLPAKRLTLGHRSRSTEGKTDAL